MRSFQDLRETFESTLQVEVENLYVKMNLIIARRERHHKGATNSVDILERLQSACNRIRFSWASSRGKL